MKTNSQKLIFQAGLFIFIGILVLTFIISVLSIMIVRAGMYDALSLRNPLMPVFFVLAICIVTSVVVLYFINRLILKPVKKLVASVDAIAAGDFTIRVNESNNLAYNNLIDSVNKMVEELENTKIFHEEFISNFTHEFNTPLASIKGFVELLQNDSLPKEEQDMFKTVIIEELNRLSLLSKNVLLLTRLENQSIVSDKVMFDLAEQIRKSILLLSKEWEDKEIAFKLDLEEVNVYGNEDLLNQVWLNLISNAIKFSEHGGEVAISLSAKNGKATCVIQDFGVGIDKEKTKFIFNKFYQAEESHNKDGNGLGLAIVKQIISLHSGKIECLSEQGQGTKFIVTLDS